MTQHWPTSERPRSTTTRSRTTASRQISPALRLPRSPRPRGIVALERDRASHLDTTFSPEFLGLTKPGGVWSQLGGQATAGAGVVVGIVDSGIWPENPAFSGDKIAQPPADWHGACTDGFRFKAALCNNKLVGARYYVEGFGRHNIAKEEFLSPRDGSGHGSHTASTAAGNAGTTMTIDGNLIGTGSGMAPAASVAAYKVCWEGKPGIAAGCFNSDSVAAINDAILDGVDVLNYSIGGSGLSRPSSTRWRWRSGLPPTLVFSWPTRPATADRARAPSTTRRRG